MKKQPIKKLRENKNISALDFAKTFSISPQYLELIESGKFSRLNVELAIKMADYFGTEVENIEWRPIEE